MDWDTQTSAILDGQVDVGYLRMPVRTDGLCTVTVAEEPCEVLLPATHRLAAKDALELSDLSTDLLLQPAPVVPGWIGESAAAADHAAPTFATVEEKLEHVAAGAGVVVLPRSAAGYYTRPDVAHVRISDLDPIRIVLAWDRSRDEPLIDEYAEIARALSTAAVDARPE
jgi:DNA-binding transcriptional LysR family regulator